jgi:hypothetical protein
MTLQTNGHSLSSVQQQLRALDKEHRETQVALNQAEASVNHARKLDELNYHRRKRAILAEHAEDHQEELHT